MKYYMVTNVTNKQAKKDRNAPKCYKWLYLVDNVTGNLKCFLLKYALMLSIINMPYFKTRKMKREIEV